ncbi:ribonuclease P protein component [Leifsonia sp. fls2-241-R2A-40a]|uniref:ribonuclease P protein component n=1 Tax=Leifsonia sp. fls2-241-R2A-40a TaxID=3040290 RepID=UPI00254D62C7|nr:ribonuclease P protein component [Leifsonia sp. fls2-241-R2A-40a]
MLAKANRITRGADYRATVRRGSRSTGASTVTYIRPNPDSSVVRFGFIVSKSVGNAVRRNLVRRRLKAAAYELLPRFSPGSPGDAGVDVVVRALPASAQAPWASLHEELLRASARLTSRSHTSKGSVSP